MNLIIDIGNTQTKAGLVDEGGITHIHSFTEFHNIQVTQLLAQNPTVKKTIISSVSSLDSEVKTLLEAKLKIVLYLDENMSLPIEVLYKSRNTLGNDRIAAAVGANNIYSSSNVLIIDAGTAITYDFVNDKNQYLGGNISPGLRMRFNALHKFTSRLPLLGPVENEMLTGDSTDNAIISGVQKGMIFEIDGYIEAYLKKYPDCKFVMTGGDAIFFDKKLKNTIFVNLNLVILGLNRILEYNAK